MVRVRASRLHRRRSYAFWLVLLALIAQQLGVVAHGAMLMRHALAGPGSDFCTVAVPGERSKLPALPAAPSSVPQADASCAACATAFAPAVVPTPAATATFASAGEPDRPALPSSVVFSPPRTAHQTRAPPLAID